MKLAVHGKTALMLDNSESEIITNCVDMLQDDSFNEHYIENFCDDVTGILNDYAELIGEGTEVDYSLKKKLMSVELKLRIRGESFDPFTSGSGAKKRKAENLTTHNLNVQLPTVSYKYKSNCNIVTMSVPLSERRKSPFKDSTVNAIILGVIFGLICRQLPDSINSFIIDDIASPIKSVVLGVISGIMGPVIFLSMATSIISMESINDLTDLGFKILKRFIVILLFLAVLSLFFCAFFFHSFGTESIDFSPGQLISMVIDIIPTNLFTPFTENNSAQLVILGVLLGSALLLLGDSVSGLNDIITQINDWIMCAMKIILKVSPLIPFLCIMIAIAQGNYMDLFKGWKFIIVVYIIFIAAIIIKSIKTHLVAGTSIRDFWVKIKPIIKTSFVTGSNAAPMKQVYEISDKDLGIKPEFTSFWIPMCSSLLSIKTTIYLIPATLMVAEISGISVTTSFLFVLILVTMELSLASPGVTSAWTSMFEVLGLSTDYVGFFSVYRLLTDNFCTAATMGYSLLEQLEAAHKLGGMKEEN